MKDIELKKMYLEQERKTAPLKPHWLKKDFMLPCETVLVYYQIEPSVEQLKARDMQIIKAVDYLGMYEVLMSSEFVLQSGQFIKLVDFVQWIIDKKFDIPMHLKTEESEGSASPSECEIKDVSSDLELSSIRLPVLIGELAKRLMVKLAQDPRYKGKAATDIIREAKEFKAFRAAVVNLRDSNEDYSNKQYQRWTSSSGPRARK